MNRRQSPARRTEGENLHLRLLNGETLRFRRYELLRVLLHPYILGLYSGLAVILVVTDPSVAQYTPLNERLIAYLPGLVAALICFCSVSTLLEWRRSRNGRVAVVSTTPIMLMAALVGVSVSQTLARLYVPDHVVSAKLFFILVIFYLVVVEAMVQFTVWLLLPRVLAQLRAQPPAGPPPAGPLPQTKAVPPGALLRVGDRSYPMAEILHLEARGNYVVIHLPGTQAEVPGPFTALVDQMPAALGQRIHRSHWVARSAVQGHHRKGRDMLLDLSNGGTAPVAMPRQPAVLDWLAAPAS